VSADRVQVGLPEDANEMLKALHEDTPYFNEEADVYRVAVAIALARKAQIPDKLTSAKLTTKFRSVKADASLDDDLPRLDTTDGKLARMIELFCPESASQPYRYSQYLAAIGINYVHRELIDRGRTLSQAMDTLGVAGEQDAR
jgi:hypothetical protein